MKLNVAIKTSMIAAIMLTTFSSSTYADSQTVSAMVKPAKAGKTLIAHVALVKGSLIANEPGISKSRKLTPSSNVYLHDTLVTGPNSHALIVYTDNSVMTLRDKTKIYINQYQYKPAEKNSAGRFIVDLITGGFRTITGLIAKDSAENYNVNTPVATIGVRGTEYSAVYQGDKVYAKHYQGSPCLSNENAAGRHSLCLDKKHPYASATKGEAPVFLDKAPAVFSSDVEIVPLTFSNSGEGFCSSKGCETDAAEPAKNTHKPYLTDFLNSIRNTINPPPANTLP